MFIERLTELCKEKGISLSAAVNDIGLNKSNVVFWKRGSKPSSDTLRKLADYFDVSIDYLLGTSSSRERIGENDMLRFEDIPVPDKHAGTWVVFVDISGERRSMPVGVDYQELLRLADLYRRLSLPDREEILAQMAWKPQYRQMQAEKAGLLDYYRVTNDVESPLGDD